MLLIARFSVQNFKVSVELLKSYTASAYFLNHVNINMHADRNDKGLSLSTPAPARHTTQWAKNGKMQ